MGISHAIRGASAWNPFPGTHDPSKPFPCTQPSAWRRTTEVAPSPFVDARLTDPSAPLGIPDCSGGTEARIRAVHGRASPLAVTAPPLLHHLCPASVEGTRAVRLAQPLDLRVLLHVQIRCTGQTLPPGPCPMLPWALCSASTVLGDRVPPRRPSPKRWAPKRWAVDRLQQVCCVASVAVGATRGRRDAGHRAPRSVAGRRRGPEGKGSGPGNHQRWDAASQPPQQGSAAGVLGCSQGHEVPDTTARGATSQSEDPPSPRGEPRAGEPSPVCSTSTRSRRGRTAGGAEHWSHVKERCGSASR